MFIVIVSLHFAKAIMIRSGMKQLGWRRRLNRVPLQRVLAKYQAISVAKKDNPVGQSTHCRLFTAPFYTLPLHCFMSSSFYKHGVKTPIIN
jgi:hypothetical protein